MDDVLRREPPRARSDRIADRDRAEADSLPFDLLPAGTLDRSGDAGAHPEAVVGGIRDRVDLEGC